MQPTVLRSRATPKEVRTLATKHRPLPLASQPPPMPFLPSQGSSSLPPPPPPDWPFPMSVEELGWVQAAVVMARRLDQEQRWRNEEYGDDHPFDLQLDESHKCLVPSTPDHHRPTGDGELPEPSVHDGYHAYSSDTDTAPSVASPPWSPRSDSPTLHNLDFNTSTAYGTHDYEYEDDDIASNSVVSASPCATLYDIDSDMHGWEESSASPV